MEIIKLNLIPNGVNPTCHAKQYDEGRVIRFELFDGLTPYTLQSGDTVTLNLRKPDNTIIETSVTATQGNKYVDLVTTEQMCACVGYNLGTFKIVNGSVDIGTLNFIMAVERDVLADGIPSQSVIEDLDELVAEAVGDNYYTKTEVDAALALKANQSTTYTKTEINTALDAKANITDLNDFNNSIYCNTLRANVSYPFGTDLNNAYAWLATDIFVPRGQSGKLTCLNLSTKINEGKTLYVILLAPLGNGNYKVIKNITLLSVYSGVDIYISKELTKDNPIYFAFYSNNGGICYQTSGDRCTGFTRYTYNSEAVGVTVTPSGTFNIDFAFGLSCTNDVVKDNIAIVDINGNGDYTSILEAINTEPENTVIFIKAGVYNQDMTSCLRKRIILIGADRNQCIIRDIDGRYGHHPLYVSCGYFENLTIVAPYVSGESQEIGSSDLGAYAVHIDTDEDYGVGKALEFHHCTIKSDFFAAMGIGLRTNMPVIIDDCELVNNQVSGRGEYSTSGSLGALYFHDSNGAQGNQYITLKDCVLKSSLGYSMTPYQVTRDPQNNKVYCEFINNVLHDKVNGYTNNIWFRGDPFNASTGIFEIEIGFGNSNNSLNNN